MTTALCPEKLIFIAHQPDLDAWRREPLGAAELVEIRLRDLISTVEVVVYADPSKRAYHNTLSTMLADRIARGNAPPRSRRQR